MKKQEFDWKKVVQVVGSVLICWKASLIVLNFYHENELEQINIQRNGEMIERNDHDISTIRDRVDVFGDRISSLEAKAYK